MKSPEPRGTARRPRIVAVAGARPNFMKIAPLLHEIRRRGTLDVFLVHTGQHYDAVMSDGFFRDLGIPDPDANLGVGSGSHAVQTAEVMTRIEAILLEQRPDAVLVVGDVNSTLAATIAAVKLGIPRRARRGGTALVRPRDARRDQPPAHRCGVDLALRVRAVG